MKKKISLLLITLIATISLNSIVLGSPELPYVDTPKVVSYPVQPLPVADSLTE